MIQHDIDVLATKLAGTFEKYPTPDNPDVKKYEEEYYTGTSLQLVSRSDKILSQIYGRWRAFDMMNMTREDLFKAHQQHKIAQSSVYLDLVIQYKDMGLEV